jgi:hypothetical protein
MSSNICPQPINCDFEDPDFEFCSWLNLNNSLDNFDWNLYSPDVSSPFGLVNDTTLQNGLGHFALASSKTSGTYARLFSENMPATSDSGACFSFYYYFNGGNYKISKNRKRNHKLLFNHVLLLFFFLRFGLQFDGQIS